PCLASTLRQLRRVERGVVSEDRPLQVLQLAARFEAELIDECAARVTVCVQCVGLAPTAVERDHQLPAKPLAKRVLPDERLEFGDELAVPTELELAVDGGRERIEPFLGQPLELVARERLERDVGQRRSAPQRERFPIELIGLLPITGRRKAAGGS